MPRFAGSLRGPAVAERVVLEISERAGRVRGQGHIGGAPVTLAGRADARGGASFAVRAADPANARVPTGPGHYEAITLPSGMVQLAGRLAGARLRLLEAARPTSPDLDSEPEPEPEPEPAGPPPRPPPPPPPLPPPPVQRAASAPRRGRPPKSPRRPTHDPDHGGGGGAPLGHYWFQPAGSGPGRCWRESVLHHLSAEAAWPFVATYAPPSLARAAAAGRLSLSFSLSCATGGHCFVLLSFRSPHNYVALRCDARRGRWTLERTVGDRADLLCAADDAALAAAPEGFHAVRVLLFGARVWVAVGGVPLMCGVAAREGDALAGLPGVAVPGFQRATLKQMAAAELGAEGLQRALASWGVDESGGEESGGDESGGDDDDVDGILERPADGGGPTLRDVAGLEEAKTLLQQAVVLPQVAPELFRGAAPPPRRLLVAGEPGGGKTMLARALARVPGARVLRLCCYSLAARAAGDAAAGQALLTRAVDAAARAAPCALVLDEPECLLAHGRRCDAVAANALGAALDELPPDVAVVLLCVQPWLLPDAIACACDHALLLPPPHTAARLQILRAALAGMAGAELLARAAEQCEGYSGADVAGLAREIAMGPVRDAYAAFGDAMQPDDIGPVTEAHVAAGLERVCRTVEDVERGRYREWLTG